MNTLMIFLLRTWWLSGVIFLCACAHAQNYPTRPIKFIVPWPPGGGADILARMITPKLAEVLGQAVVIDNRGGAAGNIGAELASKSLPDGYSILFAYSGTHSINPHMMSKMPFSAKDFSSVIFLTLVPEILVVNPSLPVKNVKELIALAKTSVNPMTFGSAGNGSINHLTGVLFEMMSGVQLLHIPYRGGGPALNSILAGETQLFFGVPAILEQQIKAGKLKALGVTSAHRTLAFPDLPTITESGVPGYDVTSWNGVMVPSGTPLSIINKLNEAFNKTLTSPELRQKLIDSGFEPIGGEPDKFAKFVNSELNKWAPVVKKAGLQPGNNDEL